MLRPTSPGPATVPATTPGQLEFTFRPPHPGVPRFDVPQLPPSHSAYAYVGLTVSPLKMTHSGLARIAHCSFWLGAMNRSSASPICTKVSVLRTFGDHVVCRLT